MSSATTCIRSRILGVGSYVPPRVWKNDDLKQYDGHFG